MAKVSGENIEKFSERIISDSDKTQIVFAVNQLFLGMSLLEWMKPKTSLADAWRASLDKIRDYVFSFNEQNYIIDYLRIAVFEHRQQALKTLESSLHMNEYINYPIEQYPELEKSANEKIKMAIDILKKVLSNLEPGKPENIQRTPDDRILQQQREYEHDRERTRK